MGRTAADHRRRGFKRRTFGVRAARSGAGAVRLSWRTAAPRNSTDGHRPFHSSPRDVRLALARRSRTKLPKTVKPGAPLASGLQPLAQEARFLGDPSSLDRSEHAPFLAVTACFSLHSPASCFCCARSSSNQAPIARSGVRTTPLAAKAIRGITRFGVTDACPNQTSTRLLPRRVAAVQPCTSRTSPSPSSAATILMNSCPRLNCYSRCSRRSSP